MEIIGTLFKIGAVIFLIYQIIRIYLEAKRP